MAKKEFTLEEAKQIGNQIGISWQEFDVDQFRRGLNVELEHGTRISQLDVTANDPIKTAKIALAHLFEEYRYYDYLTFVEDKKYQHLKNILFPTTRVKIDR